MSELHKQEQCDHVPQKWDHCAACVEEHTLEQVDALRAELEAAKATFDDEQAAHQETLASLAKVTAERDAAYASAQKAACDASNLIIREQERAEAAEAKLAEYERQWQEDKPLAEDEAIQATDRTRMGEAFRLVGAKHSKFALVRLVNWLLSERDQARSFGYAEATENAARIAEGPALKPGFRPDPGVTWTNGRDIAAHIRERGASDGRKA